MICLCEREKKKLKQNKFKSANKIYKRARVAEVMQINKVVYNLNNKKFIKKYEFLL